MPEKECKYQEGVYKVQTFRTTQFEIAMHKSKYVKIGSWILILPIKEMLTEP
jgi:hypothetical protein